MTQDEHGAGPPPLTSLDETLPCPAGDGADLAASSGLGEDFHEKYALEGKLGAGAMGQVFLARHRALDRRLAVKTVHGLDESRRAMFLREGRALVRLQHPCILDVHDADESGVPYLAFE